MRKEREEISITLPLRLVDKYAMLVPTKKLVATVEEAVSKNYCFKYSDNNDHKTIQRAAASYSWYSREKTNRKWKFKLRSVKGGGIYIWRIK